MLFVVSRRERNRERNKNKRRNKGKKTLTSLSSELYETQSSSRLPAATSTPARLRSRFRPSESVRSFVRPERPEMRSIELVESERCLERKKKKRIFLHRL